MNKADILWSSRSYRNATEIKGFIQRKFSDKEVENFYKLLSEFEESVRVFPKLYPVSTKYPELRKAVLNKQLTVFYQYSMQLVQVVAMKDNRQDGLLK